MNIVCWSVFLTWSDCLFIDTWSWSLPILTPHLFELIPGNQLTQANSIQGGCPPMLSATLGQYQPRNRGIGGKSKTVFQPGMHLALLRVFCGDIPGGRVDIAVGTGACGASLWT